MKPGCKARETDPARKRGENIAVDLPTLFAWTGNIVDDHIGLEGLLSPLIKELTLVICPFTPCR